MAAFQAKVGAGIERSLQLNGGIPPTYFTYQVDEYDGLPEKDPQGRPYIRARRFTPQVLPLFLEGPVRAYKILPLDAARALYRQVKASPLFDQKLNMYKVNASLAGQPHDIGRARAFPAGWLENESIWLHMEYKYLLETLRAGLYEEFFTGFPRLSGAVPRPAASTAAARWKIPPSWSAAPTQTNPCTVPALLPA